MTRSRRRFLHLVAATAALLGLPAAGYAQAGPTALVQGIGTQLVQIVNAPGGAEGKTSRLQPVIDGNIAVDGIARFALGHYWTNANPAQQAEYLRLFHSVLLRSIVSHLGSYRGVSFTMGNTTPAADGTLVETVINRPNEQPITVQWVVSDGKVIDVVAEGASLRNTQRADYTSYLARHNGDVGALNAALQRQVAQNAG